VRMWACMALAHLAHNDIDMQRAIHDCGFIRSIVIAMTEHANNSSVQEWGSKALSNLATNNARRLEIGAAGGIARIIAAVMASQVVPEWGISALINLASDDGVNQTKIAEQG
jgi:hypothetical protein